MATWPIDRMVFRASAAAIGLSLVTALVIAWKPALLIPALGIAFLLGIACLDPVVPLVAAMLLAPLDVNFLLGASGASTTNTNTVSILVFVLIVGATLRCVVLGQLRIRPMIMVCLVLGAALFVITVSTIAVELRSGVTFAAQILTPVAAYLVARDAQFSVSKTRAIDLGKRAIVSAIVLAFVLTAIILVLGRTAESLSGENVSRFTGSLGSGSFAFFLLPPLIVNMAALSVRSTRGRWLCLGILVVALVATLTRSALLAAVVAAIYFSVLSGTQGRGLIVLLLCIAFGGIFVAVSPEALNRFRPSGAVSSNVVQGTLAGREDLWEYVWRTDISPSPLVGSGLGATAPIFAQETSFRTGAGAVHNDYLDVWAQVGLLGLGGYAVFLLVVLFGSMKTAIQQRRDAVKGDEWLFVLRCAIPPLILAFMIVSFFDNAAANFVHMGVPLFILAGFARRPWASPVAGARTTA